MKDRKDVQNYFDEMAGTYHLDSYGLDSEVYPGNYFRMLIALDRLSQRGDVKTVFDVGCGGCEPMLECLKAGFDVSGIDFSNEMLQEGKKRLVRHGFDPELAWQADFMDLNSLPARKFDAVLMLGVVGYNKDDDACLTNVAHLLRPGGVTLVEFPNDLFSLYTFNNFSVEFFMNRLWSGEDRPDELKEEMASFLEQRFDQDISRKDYKAKRKCLGGDVPYPTYNPLTIHQLLERNGLRLVKNHFYHYHALPPKWEYKAPELFRELSIKMENPGDWRGHFMCSAFLVEAEKI